MRIKKINNIQSHEIKTSGGFEFPRYKSTQESSFIFGLIMGVKNSGKTNLVLSLLENEPHLLEKGNKVWFISPTVDRKVELFQEKYPDNFHVVDGLDLDTWRDTLELIKNDVEEWKQFHSNLELLKKYLKKKKLEPEEIQQLEECDYLQDVDFDKINMHYPNINTIIIDDSMGSPLISGTSNKAKEFQRFAIRHRHLYTNLFILTQYPRGISKTLRANVNLMCVFPMRDHTIYKDAIFPEVSGLFDGSLQNFLDVMELIEKRGDHSFLTMYYDKKQFVHINWNEEVDFKETD